MLALDGRVWFLDGDSLALREAPEVDAARYFQGDPPPPASAGIAWQAPGLTRLPDGRLLILASDHEARALERGEALPAANQRRDASACHWAPWIGGRRQRTDCVRCSTRPSCRLACCPIQPLPKSRSGCSSDRPSGSASIRRCRPSRSRRKSSTSAWSVFPVPVRSLRRATPTARNGDAGSPRTTPGGNGSPTWRRRRMPSTVAGATSRRARRRCTVAMPRRCRAAIPGWRAVPGESTATGWCCTGAAWPSVANCCSARCLPTAAALDPGAAHRASRTAVPPGCPQPASQRPWRGRRTVGAGRSAPGQRHRPSPRARRRAIAAGRVARRPTVIACARPGWLPSGGRAPIQGFLKTNTPLSTRRVRRMRSSRVRWAARKRGTCASGIARPSLSPGPTAV